VTDASASTALLTDQYELTMVQAALRSGTAHRTCTFEVFARQLPPGRRYGVVGGTGRMLEGLEQFRFGPAELEYLRRESIVDDATLQFLADYRFSGDITGYAEGEAYFPHSPVLTVTASFAEACLLETFILSVLNHDSAVASAGSRMTLAAGGRPCLEMGGRRTQEHSAVAAARAAAVVNFAATSNLQAGRRWGIPTVGTAAHAFTLLHDTEEEAFAAQVQAFGADTTLLVDTYDVEAAVRKAVEIAGPDLGAVRLDSGDLVQQAHDVRGLLDSLGNQNTQIVVSSDLDEHAIAGLAAAPVNSYGVGTRLVTGSGAPTANMVYKLVEVDGLPVHKRSSHKHTDGGHKQALRRARPSGTVTEEVVYPVGRAPAPDGPSRPLTVPLMRDGRMLGRSGPAWLAEARERVAAGLRSLPWEGLKLSRGDPAIPTVRTGAPAHSPTRP